MSFCRYLFTTEGHIFPIRKEHQKKVWEEEDLFKDEERDKPFYHYSPQSCPNPGPLTSFQLPLRSKYLSQIFQQFGVTL